MLLHIVNSWGLLNKYRPRCCSLASCSFNLLWFLSLKKNCRCRCLLLHYINSCRALIRLTYINLYILGCRIILTCRSFQAVAIVWLCMCRRKVLLVLVLSLLFSSVICLKSKNNLNIFFANCKQSANVWLCIC